MARLALPVREALHLEGRGRGDEIAVQPLDPQPLADGLRGSRPGKDEPRLACDTAQAGRRRLEARGVDGSYDHELRPDRGNRLGQRECPALPFVPDLAQHVRVETKATLGTDRPQQAVAALAGPKKLGADADPPSELADPQRSGVRGRFITLHRLDRYLTNLSPGSDRVLERSQVVPVDLDQAFAFFADPWNLEEITPPWLRFRVVSAPRELSRGSLLVYRLRLFGIPVRWRTEIVEWQPPGGFTDVQTAGPYRRWEHTHRLCPVAAGTEIHDRVVYRLPFEPLAGLVAPATVSRWLKTIFDYRARAIGARFR